MAATTSRPADGEGKNHKCKSVNPAAYPSRNTEELEALRAFENLLDLKFTKPDLKRLDTRPNTDGTIELVDEEQRPLGKIEVQVRKIPDGETSYQCPIELIAYSERISLPFILVCVDVGNKRAYFRHLHRLMTPVLKPGQQSFVIKFIPKVHSVSGETQYRSQWLEIIQEYNKRISDYPRLRQIESQLNPSHISKDDYIFFQEFIENVNRLLDSDFPIVKDQFFKGVWKLGVGVSSADEAQVCFQLYVILPGDPAILVSGIPTPPGKPAFVPGGTNVIAWSLAGHNGKTIQYNWRSRSALKTAKDEAEKFVFSHLTKMLRAKSFSLFGKRLAVEYLFWFVDNFGSSIGIEEADRLNVAQLNYGMSVYLPAWASLAVPKFLGEIIRLNKDHLENVAHMIAAPPFENIACVWPPTLRPTKEEVARLIESGNSLRPTQVRFHEVSLRTLIDSVDFLIGANEQWIDRPYKAKSEKFGSWIWSGYSVDAVRHNVHEIIMGALDEYRLFIERNQITLKRSFYLQQTDAVIFVANFAEWTATEGLGNAPILDSYTVKNEDRKLPKLTLIDSSQTPSELVVEKEQLKLRGLEREIVGKGGEVAADFFKKLPMLDRVYAMLKEDLRNEYGYALYD